MVAAQVADPVSFDRHVLDAAREGDEDAGRRLMAEHGPSMLRTAWHVLASYGGMDAEDVVQEAFIAALTTDALPHGNVGAWLRTIAARKALDAARSRRRRAEDPLPDPAAGDEDRPQTGDDVLETIAVRRALARLSPTDRAVLILVDVEGRSMAEAAEILGTTNVGARLRAVRARRKLARVVRGEGS